MKSLYSEQYYRKNWDSFIKEVPGSTYINMEADLDYSMKIYVEAGLPDEALTYIRKIEAKKVEERAYAIIVEQLRVLKSLEAGTSSFGYNTEKQEVHARHEYRERFDFNCLQLADFRKKYL